MIWTCHYAWKCCVFQSCCWKVSFCIILPVLSVFQYDGNNAFFIQTGCMQSQDNSLRGSSLLACVDSREIKTCHFWHFTSSGKQTGLACVVKCPSPLPPCSKNVNTPPPLETRKYAVCIRLFSIRRPKHLSSLCFGKYSMFFQRLSQHVGFDIIWSLSCSGGLG